MAVGLSVSFASQHCCIRATYPVRTCPRCGSSLTYADVSGWRLICTSSLCSAYGYGIPCFHASGTSGRFPRTTCVQDQPTDTHKPECKHGKMSSREDDGVDEGDVPWNQAMKFSLAGLLLVYYNIRAVCYISGVLPTVGSWPLLVS